MDDDDEIEYLSEEEIAKATAPPAPELFYVYFDETGTIQGIYPGCNTASTFNFITVDFKRIEKFIVGQENTLDYVVTLVDKDTPMIIKRVENAASNTNLLLPIELFFENDPTLNVAWDLKNKQWLFYIHSDIKSQFKNLGLITPLLFFITQRNNPNFLLNAIKIDMRDLLNNDAVKVSWVSSYEEDFENIAVSTKRFFDSYGLLKNE